MERAEVLELAVAAGMDEGMDGDAACLLQFAELIVERERERAAAICHACRDHQHAPDEIAQRIVNG